MPTGPYARNRRRPRPRPGRHPSTDVGSTCYGAFDHTVRNGPYVGQVKYQELVCVRQPLTGTGRAITRNTHNARPVGPQGVAPQLGARPREQPLGGLGGVQSLVQKQAEQMLLIKAQMAELIAHHTGQPVERIVEDSEWEKWFSADEAKDYGIVDHVVTSAQDVSGGGGTA